MQNKLSWLANFLKGKAKQATDTVSNFVTGDSAFEGLRAMTAEEERRRGEQWQKQMAHDPIRTQIVAQEDEDEKK